MKVEAAIESAIWLHFLVNLASLAFPIGQVEGLAIVQPLIELLKQFGGLGLAIWLVWWHTTRTFPKMLDESKQERKELNEQHRIEMGRLELLHRSEIEQLQSTFKESIQRMSCQFKQ
jgi:hypothetical protein